MIKGISLSETEERISKYDQGEPKTVWKIGVIDSITISEIRDKIVTSETERLAAVSTTQRTTMNVNAADVEYARYGLKGFTNFTDGAGVPIKFKTEKRISGGRQIDVVTEEILSIIPFQVIEELAGYIRIRNVLSEGESKNLDLQLKL